MEACDLEENPQVFRQKTAPGPSGTLRDVQSSISSGVKPLLTSDCFDSSRFLSHVPSYRKRVSTRQNQNKHPHIVFARLHFSYRRVADSTQAQLNYSICSRSSRANPAGPIGGQRGNGPGL